MSKCDAVRVAPGRLVLGVLAGAQASLVEATQSWPELLVAHLLHVQPGTRRQLDLRPVLRQCVQLREAADRDSGAATPPAPLDAVPSILLVCSLVPPIAIFIS